MGTDTDRDRDDTGQYADRIPPERVLDVFDARDDRARPLTAGDVAEYLDIARRTAHNKLNRLTDRGDLATRKVGARGRVWWIPDPVDDTPATVDESTAESGREPAATGAGQAPDPSPGTPDDAGAPARDPDEIDAWVRSTVDDVADGWEDPDDRLAARREAARAVLAHAAETGDAVGKSDATERFLPEYDVDGQNIETWWRKNIRPVLRAVGEYDNGAHGYVVERPDGEV